MKTRTQFGVWKITNNVKINDLIMFKTLLHRTYGNFGFKRSKSPCFGLNTYTGKKYVHNLLIIFYQIANKLLTNC